MDDHYCIVVGGWADWAASLVRQVAELAELEREWNAGRLKGRN